MFGREILWTTADGDLAAAMTFAGGLPLEAVRTEFESALPELYRAGVAQEMANLAAIGREVPPQRSGDVRDRGRDAHRRHRRAADCPTPSSSCATAGSPRPVRARRRRFRAGMPVDRRQGSDAPARPVGDAHARVGRRVRPGASGGRHHDGARLRRRVRLSRRRARRHREGARDRSAPAARGPRRRRRRRARSATSRPRRPRKARAVVARYHAAGFEQIKLYTYLTPEVVKAIADEAHRLGMTVTGHVPQALTTKAGIEAGMDQINHLNYVTSMLRAPGATGAPRSAVGRRETGDPVSARPSHRRRSDGELGRDGEPLDAKSTSRRSSPAF